MPCAHAIVGQPPTGGRPGGTNTAPVLTAREGRQVLRFALAAEQSAREGRTIKLRAKVDPDLLASVADRGVQRRQVPPGTRVTAS